MIPRQLLRETVRMYTSVGIPDPETDASLLLSWLTGRDPMSLRTDFSDSLSIGICEKFIDYRTKRMQHIPLQHLTHEQYFRGHIYYVDDSVLIPRPETALLVDHVIEELHAYSSPAVLDLCSGSGCIGIEISLSGIAESVTCVDLSDSALSTAGHNAKRLNASVELIRSDLFSALYGRRFHVIVSNPPYIPTEECNHLQKEVLFEPRMALDGGISGLDFYRSIIRQAPDHLYPEGLIAFETGFDQAETIKELLSTSGCFHNIRIEKDFSGIQRMVMAYYKGKVNTCASQA